MTPLPFLVSLFLLLLCTFATAQNTTNTACCALTESALNDLSSNIPDCPLSVLETLPKKCQSCPSGLCRLDDNCICPQTFLRLSSRRSRCETSFAAIWPDSITKEDRDWRSCRANITLPDPISTSCCALSEQQLNDLRGFSSNCPSSLYSFQLGKKCDSCPSGLCRLGNECICPDQFLDRSSLHEDCVPSFTTSWPESVEKEDRATRSCRGVSAPPSSNLSCCSLTESMLDDMIGTSDRCPDPSPVRLSDECGICPSGMCRFDSRCYCPTHFKESTLKDRCEGIFGVAWPESVGKTDPDITSCGTGSDSSATPTEQGSSSSQSGEGEQSDDSPSNSKPGEPPGATNAGSNTNESSTAVVPEPRLATLEIIGIIAGVISTVVAVIALAVGLSRRRKNRRHEPATSFDEMFG